MRRLALAVLLAALFLVPRATAATSACAACRNPSFGVTPRSANGGGFPKALAAADFDGDGLLDLVTANESNDESPHGFAFLRGLPGGRFADPVYSFPVFNGSSIVAVDLDRDGRMDLVILGQEGLLVIFGNGDGTFSEPQPYLTGQNFVSSFAVGDLNGDGLPDLAATDTSGLIVLLNRGDGTFGPPTVVLGPPADQIVLGDFTGDGLLDALVGGHVYPGMGNGTFSATPAPGQVLLSPGAIARDFNRDGKLDLASLALGNLAVAYGNGDGTFDPPVVLANVTPGTGNSIAAADFNGDGWLDLLVASFSDGIVLVRSDGTGGFLPALTYATAIPPVAVTAADIDSDGRPDAIVAYQDSVSFPITVYLSNPDGSLQQELRVPSAAAALASAELTGDGKRDLVIGGMGIAVWIGDGNGGFSAGYQNASPTNVVALAIQDVNHDGHLDIVAVTRGPDFFATDGFYWVFLGDGAGGFSPLPSVHLNFAPNSAALALLNADALPYLLISGIASGIHVLIGSGDGTFVDGPPLGPGLTFGNFAVADLRGVGKLDIAAGRYSDQVVTVFLGNGDGTFQTGSDYLGVAPAGIAVGDFNGDGKIDILTADLFSSFGISLLRGRGDGTFEPAFSFPGPYFGESALAVLDFNGDGKPDIALSGPDTVLMTGNGDGTFTESARFGPVGQRGPILVEDWNGDGKPDLAVANRLAVSILINTACEPRRLAIGTPPSACAVPGAPFSVQPVANILDDGGNVVTCAAGTVVTALVPGTGSSGAMLGGSTSKPLVAGAAAFTNLSIDLAGNDYVLEFSDPPARPVRSRSLSVHSAYSVSIAGPSFVCPSSSTPFSADAGFDAYFWTLDGVKAGGGRTISLAGLTVGPHTLAVLATRAGCSASASLPIEFGVIPPSASNSGPVCVGEALQLTASSAPGGTYAWTGPNGFTSAAQNPMIPAATLAASGLYSVTVTANGCTSAPAMTSVTVTPLPFVPVAHATGVLCAGETLQLTASTVPGATYAWTGPNGFTSPLQNPTIPSAIAADSGVYSVTVTVNGCTSPAATTSVSVTACQERPVSLSSDPGGNGILEPGETAVVAPSWLNTTGTSVALTGTATSFTGPSGATYSLPDAAASYGSVAAGATASCISTSDCYSVGVSAPATRPVLHWDGAFSEMLSTGDGKTWSVHIGKSFPDVPSNSPFYRFVETLLHNGVTTGCGGGAYCPASSVTRAQMSVFLLVSQAGSAFTPSPATGVFADVPVSSPFARWIEELARRGVTAGCGSGNFCPDAGVTRAQMAVFLLVTREGAAYVPPAPTGVFPDVPAGNPFAPWIEELFHRGIAAGCGNGNYCPFDPVSRAQMAVFLTATFGLSL